MPGAGAVHHIRLGRADHLLGARMRGRCSPVSGPIPEGLDQALQVFSVLVGTVIAIIFAVFIGLKWPSVLS